jgi:thymidylate synthase (FAD)
LNLRELIHLANLRLCTRAQLEIRQAVKRMCELVIEKEPWLAEHLVPKCERLGYCDEDNSCGRMKTKEGK